MILRLGEVAGLKGMLQPYSMHDVVKVVCKGLKKTGVSIHRCRNPYHLNVAWGDMLKKSTRSSNISFEHIKIPKHATADDGP